MLHDRLTAAQRQDAPGLFASGPILAVGVADPGPLAQTPAEAIAVVQPFRPAFDRIAAAGYSVTPDFAGIEIACPAVALVAVPRARERARAWIAEAVPRLAAGGWLVVDGDKTDGIDAMHRALRDRLDDYGSVTKAHGRLLWGRPRHDDTFSDWRGVPGTADGHVTAPGVFSAGHVDPGSRALCAAIAPKLEGHVVDLGAGWGYLSARLLADHAPGRIDLVEADHDALQAARVNVADPRARFHWADARFWRPDALVDAVVMNPPFHEGRRPDPDLGRAFIASAAAMLRPGGTLWMVANRHLPYEGDLDAAFARWQEVGGEGAYKLIVATRGRVARKGRRQ